MIIVRQKEFTGRTKLINKARKNLVATDIGMRIKPEVMRYANEQSNIKRLSKRSPIQFGRYQMKHGTDFTESKINQLITERDNNIVSDHMPKSLLKKIYGKDYYHPDSRAIRLNYKK